MRNCLGSSYPALLKRILFPLVIIYLITLPAYTGEGLVSVFLLIMLYISLGQMWNLLAGYTGLVSLGQQIFTGIGGYSLAVISETYHLNFFLGIFVGGIISTLFALVISRPLFKMKGVYFTIGSWVIAETLALFFLNWRYVRAGIGFNITATYDLSTTYLYYIALAVGLGSIILVYAIMRTKRGLGIMAMRDNETAAEVLGIELYRTKLVLFLITSFVTGITGGAMYLFLSFIQPQSAFGIDWTVASVFIVIIGGIGTMEGPIIGAIIYVFLKQYLYAFPGISMIILGAIAIVIILIAPRGIMGTLYDRFGIQILSTRRE